MLSRRLSEHQLVLAGRLKMNPLAIQNDAAIVQNQNLGNASFDAQSVLSELDVLLQLLRFLSQDMNKLGQMADLLLQLSYLRILAAGLHTRGKTLSDAATLSWFFVEYFMQPAAHDALPK
jgi:hypothetical protein